MICVGVKRRGCQKEKMRRGKGVKMICVDVKMRDVKIWKCEDVKMRRCEDVKIGEDDMCRCEGETM